MFGARSLDTTWRTSTWSISGECVEIASIGTEVLIRDSKNRGGRMLSFSSGTWRQFIEQSKGTTPA
jgi:hypothetical protein